MMRLGLPLMREGTLAKRDPSAGGYPLESRFNIPAGDNKFLFQFPREEILNNRAVQQNPIGEQIKDTFQRIRLGTVTTKNDSGDETIIVFRLLVLVLATRQVALWCAN